MTADAAPSDHDPRSPAELDSLIQVAMMRPRGSALAPYRDLARAVSARLAHPESRHPPTSSAPSDGDTTESDTIDDRYAVSGELGEGGMGRVLEGHDAKLERPVAVKLLREEHRSNENAVTRFFEEARIGGQLSHPGIVPVHDVGQDSEGQPYFTMKRVHGETLARLLDKPADARPTLGTLLGIFEKVCDTIAYAHARHVIHRDLKPSNVMIGSFGEVQIMDWGLAKRLDADELTRELVLPAPSTTKPDRSSAGSVMGTPSYMPPEQARGEHESIDKRADVFALGAILCQLLTGSPPYRGTDHSAVLDRARRGDLADATARLRAAKVDADLSVLALDCLAAERAGRPAHAGIVSERVAAYRRSADARLEEARVAAARARARFTLLASAVAVAALALGTWYWLRTERLARQRHWTDALELALADAEEAVDRARASQAEDSTDASAWKNAEAQASQVRQLAASAIADPAIRARVETFLRNTEHEATRARERAAEILRDRRMRSKLRTLRDRPAAVSRKDEQATDYREAYAGYGLDPLSGELESSVKRVRDSDIREALIHGLDAWAEATYGRHDDAAKQSTRLLTVAQRADENPVRRALRNILLTRDVGTRKSSLAALAKELDVGATNPATLVSFPPLLAIAGQVDLALDILRRAVDRYPGNFRLQYDYALLLERNGRGDESMKHLEIARALRPDADFVWVMIARLHAEAGRAKEVRRTLERSERWTTDTTGEVHYRRGWIWIRLREWPRAAQALRKAVDARPSKRSWRYFLAVTLVRSNRRREAARALEPGLDLENITLRQLPAVHFYGVIVYDLGQLYRAREVFRHYCRARNQFAERVSFTPTVPGEVILGQIAARFGDLDLALRRIESSHRRKATALTWTELGNLHAKRAKFELAAKCAREAIALDPSRAFAYRILAHAQRGLGEYDRARRSYAKALDLGNPRTPGFVSDCRTRERVAKQLRAFTSGERPMPTSCDRA